MTNDARLLDQEPATLGARPTRWSALARRLELDRAVVFMISARMAQMVAFPVTLLLIARFLTAEMQGFYYTFGSVLALQMFVELGFTYVIINVASHEWAHLSLDADGNITGDPVALSRLISLGRLIFRWYAVAAAIFGAGAATAGWIFFSRSGATTVHWQAPLFSLIAVSSLLLWTLPFNSLLEGCNQVESINRLRLTQIVAENAALWGTLALGGGLWAAVAAISAKLLRDLYLLLVQYRNFFRPFFHFRLESHVSWGQEIWPMQWRLAAAAVATYFASALYNPIMFRYHGAVVAGRTGMTMQAIMGLQLVPMAWVLTKAPRYGMLIARRDYEKLDRLWVRNSLISVGVMIAGCCAVWIAVIGLGAFHVPLAARLLPPLPTAIFLVAALLVQICQCFVAYLRAHKREPILASNLTGAFIAATLILLLGRRFGPLGAAYANLTQMVITVIWVALIWRRCRTEWHA